MPSPRAGTPTRPPRLGGAPTPPAAVLLEVGRIARPHGLRGEVVVDLFTNRTERLEPGSTLDAVLPVAPPARTKLLVAPPARTKLLVVVARARPQSGRFVVAFEGIDDREAAEALRGVVLRAAPLDDPSAMWAHQLIGCRVRDPSGRDLGRVSEIEANPASDILVLDTGDLVPVRFVVEHGPGAVVIDPPEGLLS